MTPPGIEQLGDINPSSFSFLLLGIALVVMMRFRPEGFLPSRQRAAEMHTAPPGEAIGSIGALRGGGRRRGASTRPSPVARRIRELRASTDHDARPTERYDGDQEPPR